MKKEIPLKEYIDRQLRIPSAVKGWSQELLEKTFLVIGVGGNGTHVALALVCMGAREIRIIDKDVVDPSNISRQVLYGKDDVGHKKVDVAIEALEKHSFHTKIKGYDLDILDKREKCANLVAMSDFVFTLVDNYPAVFFASNACLKSKRPMMHGGTDPYAGHDFHITLQEPKGKPCWNCLHGTGNRTPNEWVRYYSSIKAFLSSFDMRKVIEYNYLIRMPKRSASIYYTASIGSNLMVLNMMNWLRSAGYYHRIICNLLTMEIWKWRVNPREDCVSCAKQLTK